MRIERLWIVPMMLTVALLAGCDNDSSKPPVDAKSKPATQPIIPVTQVTDWCPEHGVPESICTRCNESLVAGFKAKNDWCGEHGLPDSQCFKHHPALQAKFAAAYKEKYGKDAPAIEHK